MDIKFLKNPRKASRIIIIPVFEEDGVPVPGKHQSEIDSAFLAKILKTNKKFTGAANSNLSFALPDDHTDFAVLCGLGKKEDLTSFKAQEAGGSLYAALSALPCEHATLLMDKKDEGKTLKNADLAAHIAFGFKLRSYNFDVYKSKKEEDAPSKLEQFDIVMDAHSAAQKSYESLDHIASGVFTARNLVNEPPNELYPESFAALVKKELKPLGVEIEVLDDKKMEKMGMGAILAVGKGSERKPRMVVMKWNGSPKNTNPLLLVGKGVTFDTGGISIKPGAGMDEMKMDMGGAAAVVGTMKAIAGRKAKANVVGIIGLAENMPSHNAYRPGDVLKSYSGKTIEVLNTDAEGRLVLADCLTYGQEICKKPAAIIDLATLTGAMMVALAHEYCGTFVNDDGLWSAMEKASQISGEKLWRMPLDEAFKKSMEGNFGDVQNLSKMGRYGGACTAAGFLEYFIEKDTPWAHMDIAGTAWIKKDLPTVPKFGTGFGVRILDSLISGHYEG
ncbi:MAG: leucyl aminopeptidase [Alphaproteobacteria bacterium]